MSINSSQFHLVSQWRCTWCTSPASCTRRTGRPQIQRTSRKVSQFSDFSLRLVITVAWQGFSIWKYGPSRLNMYLIRYRAKWAPSWWWKNGSSLQKTFLYWQMFWGNQYNLSPYLQSSQKWSNVNVVRVVHVFNGDHIPRRLSFFQTLHLFKENMNCTKLC